ncbi:MAG TPA: ABC transporter ATP-binding protein [Acidimicrobiales bacterium]
MPAVQVTDLRVCYGRSGEVVAVDGLSLSADLGEVLVILGPNGAGKTSTIEALEGYRRPVGGTLRVLGLDPQRDHAALMPHIGVMLQRGGVYPMLNPRQVLALFARYYRRPLAPEALLDLVALRSVASTPWRHLSGGEQQRLSLALALIGQPEVLFLDEPTAGVDAEGRIAIRQVVADLRAKGACVLLTTHELAEAERMADRIAIVDRGRVIREGALSDLTAGGRPAIAFGAPAGLDVIALADVLGAQVTVTETGSGRYLVDGASGPDATAALTRWLAEQQAALSDLRTVRTLEDVYLEAVGTPPEAEQDEPPESISRRRRRR